SLTVMAPVSVSVTAATASLYAAKTQLFNAAVSGGPGKTSVTWSLSPSLGSIDTAGLYTAPAIVAAQQTVTVTATSVADPAKSASASLTVMAPVSVFVTPATVSLYPGKTQQFTATVTG